MKKILILLTAFVILGSLFSTVIAEVPKEVSGSLKVEFTLSHNAILPYIFSDADQIFVRIDGSGKDLLLFYTGGTLLQEVNINEKNGETDFDTPFHMLNICSSLEKINFDWEDDFGVHEFRSCSIHWYHKDGLISTMWNILLGHSVVYEVVLKKIK